MEQRLEMELCRKMVQNSEMQQYPTGCLESRFHQLVSRLVHSFQQFNFDLHPAPRNLFVFLGTVRFRRLHFETSRKNFYMHKIIMSKRKSVECPNFPTF